MIEAARRSPARILIAEDSPTQAMRLRHMLEQHGYEVHVAGDGRTALEMTRSLQPALVVSDVNMPEMSGYELTRAIKDDAVLKAIPVILVTSMSDPQEVIRGLECGADSFILKPYEDRYLVGRIQYVLINREYRQSNNVGLGVEIQFNGQRHHITADRMQILDLLLSTYEAAIQRNKELSESKESLERVTAEVVDANKFLDSLIENIPTAIFLKTADDLRYVRVNRSTEALTGYERAGMLGQHDIALFPADYAEMFTADDERVLARGEISDIPALELPTKLGKRILHFKKVPIRDQYGQVTHLLGIAEDVTEQRVMEQDIRRLNAELKDRASHLEASNKGLESFASTASHDLRSPLSVIGAYAGLLEKHYASALDDRGLGFLRSIRSNVRRMATLVEDLLAFSRWTGKALVKEEFSMDALVRDVADEQLASVPDSGQLPQIVLHKLPNSHADPALLGQIWVNLISNALKYSSKSQAPRIEVSGSMEGDHNVYSVRDNGVGFSMEHVGKLFGAFQRLHDNSEFEGTGIGLVIVQQIAQRHGGRAWAEAEEGKGAVFYFSLPNETGKPWHSQ